MVAIPFVRDFDFEYGRADAVSPLIRRLIANNPGPFTFTGTGTYIVGHGEVAVIDPGPDRPEHLEAILKAVEGERVAAILVTHSHADHSPLARPLAEATGARIYGAPPVHALGHSLSQLEEAHDEGFAPDEAVSMGSRIAGPGWSLAAIPTPGHTANHVCYALLEENALFTGDHVMGWSTTVVIPPDGDMAQYCASLDVIRHMGFSTLWPTHGPPVTEPAPFLAAYLAHRQEREAGILREVRRAPRTVGEIVERLYAGVDLRLRAAAAMSVWAHLIALARNGEVESDDGRPLLSSVYRAPET
jgi:glyoxylase-like metal-dependent hydrolase (beta-lactamase superfamily II)